MFQTVPNGGLILPFINCTFSSSNFTLFRLQKNNYVTVLWIPAYDSASVFGTVTVFGGIYFKKPSSVQIVLGTICHRNHPLLFIPATHFHSKYRIKPWKSSFVWLLWIFRLSPNLKQIRIESLPFTDSLVVEQGLHVGISATSKEA